MSFVVVFPTDPVTPTTGSAASRRTWRARSARPFVVSATRTRAKAGGRGRVAVDEGGAGAPRRRPRRGSRGRRTAGP